MFKAIRIYPTRSVVGDIAVFLGLAPLWWLLGVGIVFYHIASAWVMLKLIAAKANESDNIAVPPAARLLVLLIIVYGVSLVINSPKNEAMRTVASVYNYSFWIMGAFIIIAVYNSHISFHDIRRLKNSITVLTVFVGIAVIFSVFLWFQGYQEIRLASPTMALFDSLSGYKHFRASTEILLYREGVLLHKILPRASALSPYPTALAATLTMAIPVLVGAGLYLRGRMSAVQLFAVLLGVVSLVFTFARAPLVALLLASGVVMVLRRKDRIRTAVIIGIAMVALAPFIFNFASWINNMRGYSYSIRMATYAEAVKTAAMEAPLLGIGIKPRVAEYVIPVGSHSTYIGLFLRTGLIGLATLIAFQALVLWSWFRALLKFDGSDDKRLVPLWLSLGIVLISMSIWMLVGDIDAIQLTAFLYFTLVGISIKLSAEMQAGVMSLSKGEGLPACDKDDGLAAVTESPQDSEVPPERNSFLKELRGKLCCSKDGQIKPGRLVTFVNPYSYLTLRKTRGLLGELDAYYLDGILMVWIFGLFGIKRCTRVSFDMTSLAPAVLGRAQAENLSVYIIGTTPELIGLACRNIKERFPGLNLVGSRHGYFRRTGEIQELIESIRELDPDIVVAGMGTPLQEELLVDLRRAGWGGTGFTCGGFLHQTANDIDYYPGWINRYNLRWLYRMYDEPRLAFRYFILYPVFLVLFLRDYWKMIRRPGV